MFCLSIPADLNVFKPFVFCKSALTAGPPGTRTLPPAIKVFVQGDHAVVAIIGPAAPLVRYTDLTTRPSPPPSPPSPTPTGSYPTPSTRRYHSHCNTE